MPNHTPGSAKSNGTEAVCCGLNSYSLSSANRCRLALRLGDAAAGRSHRRQERATADDEAEHSERRPCNERRDHRRKRLVRSASSRPHDAPVEVVPNAVYATSDRKHGRVPTMQWL